MAGVPEEEGVAETEEPPEEGEALWSRFLVAEYGEGGVGGGLGEQAVDGRVVGCGVAALAGRKGQGGEEGGGQKGVCFHGGSFDDEC